MDFKNTGFIREDRLVATNSYRHKGSKLVNFQSDDFAVMQLVHYF